MGLSCVMVIDSERKRNRLLLVQLSKKGQVLLPRCPRSRTRIRLQADQGLLTAAVGAVREALGFADKKEVENVPLTNNDAVVYFDGHSRENKTNFGYGYAKTGRTFRKRRTPTRILRGLACV